jgi:hypothetical protein
MCSNYQGAPDEPEPPEPPEPGELPAGWRLARALETTDLADADSGALVDLLPAFEQIASWAHAGQLAVIGELLRREEPPPGTTEAPTCSRTAPPTPKERVVEEVACALSMSSGSAWFRVNLAEGLADRLPSVFDALRSGLIDLPRARVLSDETQGLDGCQAAEVVRRVLPAAVESTPAELRRRVRRAAIAVDASAAQRRTGKARAGREVWSPRTVARCARSPRRGPTLWSTSSPAVPSRRWRTDRGHLEPPRCPNPGGRAARARC